MPRTILTADLHFGDSGKGTIVDALVRRHKIPLVVRYSGGANCAHNVITQDGTHHCFSQFGSGTLAGADTLLTKDVLVDPVRLMTEAAVLSKKGVRAPFAMISVDERALVITPYHAVMNQIREIARSDSKHGSCGVGIGETASFAISHPNEALRIKDLNYELVARHKLDLLRNAMLIQIEELAPKIRQLPKPTFEQIIALLQHFKSADLIDATMWRYYQFAEIVRQVDDGQIAHMLKKDSVFEAAQGVLLDEDYGFYPNVTWSKVTLKNAVSVCELAGVTDYSTLGILRTYGHRHGPGPFPTEADQLTRAFSPPEAHNSHNEWQGHFRRGWFDLKMADYALKVAGRIDSLALTHVDILPKLENWKIARDYPVDLSPLDPQDFAAREALTAQLMKPQDINYENAVPSERVVEYIENALDKRASVLSTGPRSDQKTFQ